MYQQLCNIWSHEGSYNGFRTHVSPWHSSLQNNSVVPTRSLRLAAVYRKCETWQYCLPQKPHLLQQTFLKAQVKLSLKVYANIWDHTMGMPCQVLQHLFHILQLHRKYRHSSLCHTTQAQTHNFRVLNNIQFYMGFQYHKIHLAGQRHWKKK